ncbi:AGRG4-like protein [Mya arenaria]|uniref:AGRG4-like protein n=1 Tax=Mya arenaria TaxID=6604 RepID=A0ABY7FRW4_MYAAR|nr:AGRG4-like protein [Mya arenaria]
MTDERSALRPNKEDVNCWACEDNVHVPPADMPLSSCSISGQFESPNNDFVNVRKNDGNLISGLCREGWVPGAIKSLSGDDIPVCFKVNPQARSWREAQAECRKDYGFLLKLDTAATVNNKDLLSTVLANGVRQFWSGLHTDHGRLAWDDLVPRLVGHQHGQNQSESARTWQWHGAVTSSPQQGYCGQMNIDSEEEDDDRKRRKRSSDDDNQDTATSSFEPSTFSGDLQNGGVGLGPSANFGRSPNTNLNMRTSGTGTQFGGVASNNFGLAGTNPFPPMNTNNNNGVLGVPRGLGRGRGRNLNGFPTTGAFGSTLTRQPISDKLEALASLGIQSPSQIPGTGISDSNTQEGGLAALLPHSDSESDSHSPGSTGDAPTMDIESNSGDNTPPNGFNAPNFVPSVTPSNLLPYVKKLAANLGSGNNPAETNPAESDLEHSRNMIQRTESNVKSDFDSDSNKDQASNAMPIDTSSLIKVNKVDSDSPMSDESSNIMSLGNILSSDNIETIKPAVLSPFSGSTVPTTEKQDDDSNIDKVTMGSVLTSGDSDDKQGHPLPPVLTPVERLNMKMPEDSVSKNEQISERVDEINDKLTEHSNIGVGTVDTPEFESDKADKLRESMSDMGSEPTSFELSPVNDPNLDDDSEHNEDKNTHDTTSLQEEIKTDDHSPETNGRDLAENLGDKTNAEIFNALNIPWPSSNKTSQENEDTDDEKHDESYKPTTILPNIQFSGATTERVDMNDHSEVKTEKEDHDLPNPFGYLSDNDDRNHEKEGSKIEGEDLLKNESDLEPPNRESSFGHNEEKNEDENEQVATEDTDMSKLEQSNAKESDKYDDAIDEEGDENGDQHTNSTENLFEQFDTETENPNRNEDADVLNDIIEDNVKNKENKDVDDILGEHDHDNEGTNQDFGGDENESLERENEQENKKEYETEKVNNEVEGLNEHDNETLEENENERLRENETGRFEEHGNEHVGEKENEQTGEHENAHGDEQDNEHEGDQENEHNGVQENEHEGEQENENGGEHENEYEGDQENQNGVEHDNEHEGDQENENGGEHEQEQEGEQEHENMEAGDGERETEQENEQDSDHMDDRPELLENVQGTTHKSALLPTIQEQAMELSSCEARLPSVCFTYQVEVMDKASTCDDGWYGHVLLDTCYKPLENKMSYERAVAACKVLGGRVILAISQMERDFVFLAMQKAGLNIKGGRFWMERPTTSKSCQYFTRDGTFSAPSCNAANNVFCTNDAKSLSVLTADSLPFDGAVDDVISEARVFFSAQANNLLPCELTSAASEFPVLWFKDGVLVDAKDKYVTSDLSLLVDGRLAEAVGRHLGREMALPALQGRYWCEVWDRQTLTRRQSRSFSLRFSDVISFHGSMKLPAFTLSEEVLFNMAGELFPVLTAAYMDVKQVFHDVLPSIQAYVPDVTGVFTFMDSVRSARNVVEYHTYFTLSRPYVAADEASVYSRLKTALRSRLGNQNYMASLPGRTPQQSFRTMSLQSTVSCPAASLQTSKDVLGQSIPVREFSFPHAQLGELVHSIETCTSECVQEADAIDDLNREIWGVSPYTDKLTEIAERPVDRQNAEEVMSEVAQITRMAINFTPTDINKIADILDRTTQVDKLDAKLYAETADIGEQEQLRLVSDNVAVEIWNLSPSSRPVIGLAASTALELAAGMPFKMENIATVYNKSQLLEANVDAAIELPDEVFEVHEKGKGLSNRLTMMVFRKSKLFEAAITKESRDSGAVDGQMADLNSYVISASIAGRKLEGLKEKVKTIFKPTKDVVGEANCVWWDFRERQGQGGWSDRGCSYDGKVNGRHVCLCDHLTNFAVLIDFYGQEHAMDEGHELSLSIITVVGLSLSILGLALTIISYVFFRKLRKGRAQQTLFNLSLSLLLAMLVFLIGIRQTHSHGLCITVAVLLHYLVLVSFMWMLMEAILQYLTFVKILGTYITRFTLKTVLPAWGLPLIPVIAVLAVDPELYRGGSKYCWMDLPAFYYAFALPVSGIIVINVVIFVVTVVSIFRRGKGLRSNQKRHKMAMTNLQAAITSFVLLGLTWLFGYLAVADARLIFQYVFTILNSLQGFFIFVLFVLRKRKVREQWYFICCKGVEKGRVSRSLSASNSNSTYSNSSGRQSGKSGKDRDRSDSTKTVQSIVSNGSGGFTNFGYDHGYDFPFSRNDRRLFNRKF